LACLPPKEKKKDKSKSKQELIAQMTIFWSEFSKEKRQKLSRKLLKRIFEVEINN